jgi:DNA helicase-2/ATP-dependent DNA helicase PcrA
MTPRVDSKLHSEAPVVVIEAAAGCGKTTTAARYAREAADRLPAGRKVLLLSHTHAACGEFQRKCSGEKAQVDVETCDGFFLKAIAPYASALGLPMPLDAALDRPGSGVTFADLSKKACELFARAPTVVRAIAWCYPVIVLDEHQDASASQHQAAWLLREIGGSKLRAFGDPMQAIHPGKTETYVDWDALMAVADAKDTLDEPHRWTDAPELGQWITAARATLKAGNAVSLRSADLKKGVSVVSQTNFSGREKFRDIAAASGIIHKFFDSAPERAVILSYLTKMVWSIAQCGKWRAPINEGAQLEELGKLISAIEKDAGNPQQLALALIDFLGAIGAGLTEADRSPLCSRLGAQINRKQAGERQIAWLDCLEHIYKMPDHRGVAAAMQAVRHAALGDYKIRLDGHARSLSMLDRTDDPRGYCNALGRIRRKRASASQLVSTIHKAKGLEFDHVLVCPIDSNQYPKDGLGARLLYVAMSRARRSLRLVLAADALPVHVTMT